MSEKFFPVSMLLEALKHITAEQLEHAPPEQIERLYDELVRVLAYTWVIKDGMLESKCTSTTFHMH